MANIPIKYRTAKNFRHNQYDFSVTLLTGDLEVNFFICSAFYPSAPAFCNPVIEKKYIPD